jgi:hypothetical protein
MSYMSEEARARRHREPVDEVALEELDLFIMNSSELYPQRQAIENNVRRRIDNGTYDPAKAPKLWLYLVDNGAKAYSREFASPGDHVFSPATREALAQRLAHREYTEIVLQMQSERREPRGESFHLPPRGWYAGGRSRGAEERGNSEPAARSWPRPSRHVAAEDVRYGGALDWHQEDDRWVAKAPLGGGKYVINADPNNVSHFQTWYLPVSKDEEAPMLGTSSTLGGAMGLARDHANEMGGGRRAAEANADIHLGRYGMWFSKVVDICDERGVNWESVSRDFWRSQYQAGLTPEQAVDAAQVPSGAGERVPVLHEGGAEEAGNPGTFQPIDVATAHQNADTYLAGRNERKVANNTTMNRGASGDISILYHGNTIITYRANGSIRLSSAGYRTFTTKERFTWFLPPGYRVFSEKHEWFLRTPSGDKVPFKDGMVINADGSTLFNLPPGKPYAGEDFTSIQSAEQHAYSEGFRFIAAHGKRKHHIYKRRGVGKKGYEKRELYFRRGKWHISGDKSNVTRLGRDARAIKVSQSAGTIRREEQAPIAPPEPVAVAAEPGKASAFEDHLTSAQRKKLPARDFALPSKRALPIQNRAHVRAAAARLSMMKHEGHITQAEYDQAHARIVRRGKKLGVKVSAAHEDCGKEDCIGIHTHTPVKTEGVVVHGAAAPMSEACLVIKETGAGNAVVERGPGCAPTGRRMESPRDVWDLLHARYAKLGQEVFEVILVSNQGELIGSPITVAVGQADRVTVDIEQIIAPVVAGAAAGAKGFLIAHCHPSSGHYARPSAADKRLTEDVRRAAKEGCPATAFIDHVIICPVNKAGDGEYYSFSEGKSTKMSAAN